MKFIVILFGLIIVTGLWLTERSQFKNQDVRPDITDSLYKVLPSNIFLRDFVEIDKGSGKWMVVYIEPGYKEGALNENSCPGNILGIHLAGKYHLALVENGQLVNEITLPKAYNSEFDLELNYRDSEGNINQLIKLQDLNNDGLKNEFLLTTTGGGCGMFDGLVAGYDNEENKVRLFSEWLFRFQPDVGVYNYVFECGDHGNNVRREVWYEYNQQNKRFEIISEIETDCEEIN